MTDYPNEYQIEPAESNVATVEPVTLPETIPTDKDELKALVERLSNAEKPPYGSGKFVQAVTQYLYRQPLFDKAVTELNRSWKFMQGVRGPGIANGAKKRSVRSRAHHFYDSLPEPAIRAHCTMHGLDYDSFETVDERIEALVQKSVELSS